MKKSRRPKSSPAKNIEIKLQVESLAPVRAASRRLGARRVGLLRQIDTYFQVREGRLKLREITGGGAELIAYRRADRKTARASNYQLTPIAEPKKLRQSLGDCLGIVAVVRKSRELWMFRNVRIHLDRVARLGSFVELEAVVGGSFGSRESAANLQRVLTAIRTPAMRPIARSYGDLVAALTAGDASAAAGGRPKATRSTPVRGRS